MTPLMPAPQPSAVPALPGAGRGTPSPPVATESFAAALEHGHAAAGEAGAAETGTPPHEPVPELAEDAPLPEAIGGFQPLPLQQPAPPPWPPAGLAGLAFSAAGAADAADPAGMLAAARPLALGAKGAAGDPAAALALPGVMPGASETLRAGADADGVPPPAFSLPGLATPAGAPAADAPPMLEAPLPAPAVRAQDFSERFGAQLQWMAGEGIGHARIRVSPQDLGPVEVMLRLDGERISAEFVSAHAETRQALEHGLPRLRDLLGEHGFQLAHAGVGHGSADADADAGSPGSSSFGTNALGDEAASDTPAASVAVSNRLLDAYA